MVRGPHLEANPRTGIRRDEIPEPQTNDYGNQPKNNERPSREKIADQKPDEHRRTCNQEIGEQSNNKERKRLAK
jgi:hypothetical protein